MKYKALFLDFYGTLVHEDDDLIANIAQKISAASPGNPDTKSIASLWWSEFSSGIENSFLDSFQTQHQLESMSLENVLKHFSCSIKTSDIDTALFEYWAKPDIFPETKEFLHENPLPICVVSNIDRKDLHEAISCHGLSFDAIVTSEDAKSYKPRCEIFQMALDVMGLASSQVLHIGDSLSSDIAGANNCGIDSFWLNRKDRPLPNGNSPTYFGNSLLDILRIL